jgi:hypothetical protein
MRSTNHEAPHYAVFSIVLFSPAQIPQCLVFVLFIGTKSDNFMLLLHKEHVYCKLKMKSISVDVLTSFCYILYLPKYEMTLPVHSHHS